MKRNARAVVQLATLIGLLIAVLFITLSYQTFPMSGVGTLKCYGAYNEHAC